MECAAFDAIRQDTPAPGLVVYQPKRGYHYSMEPFVLAGWLLEAGVKGPFLDVGTGCGILAMLLAYAGLRGEGIDVRPEWMELANRSLLESRKPNGDTLALTFRHQDVRARTPGERPFGIAVCNPPYFPADSGPVGPDPVRAFARHEMAGTLFEIVSSMARLAKSVAIVLPVVRAEQAHLAFADAGLPVGRQCILAEGLVMIHGWEGATRFQTESISLRADGGHSARVCQWYASLGAPLAGRRQRNI